jgi:hypothetical protein
MLEMNRPEVVHISPTERAWRVYRSGYDTEESFDELGDALDAATAVAAGAAVRIVIHERARVLGEGEDGPGISPAA